MIKYDKLWELLRQRGMSKYQFKRDYVISKGQLDRLKSNQSVTMNTIDKLCNTLDCDISDIMEHVKDNNVYDKRKG